ncbi:MAG: hypothetical protein KC621_28645 [Myxococcales bacterium]|nr:hypothetical protein [Myxococcales bacterium]
MPPGHRHRRVPSSRIVSFLDHERLSRALEPLVPDIHDRAFVVRCLLDEGPAHHRGANYALVTLLLELLDRIGATAAPPSDAAPVPMRLPPHLGGDEDANHPIALDVAELRRIARDEGELDAMVDCLSDGPPQHAVANVVMVDLLAAALAHLRARGS